MLLKIFWVIYSLIFIAIWLQILTLGAKLRNEKNYEEIKAKKGKTIRENLVNYLAFLAISLIPIFNIIVLITIMTDEYYESIKSIGDD